MGGKHEERSGAGLQQERQDEVEAVLGAAPSRRSDAPLGLVTESGLVAMMTIRDRERGCLGRSTESLGAPVGPGGQHPHAVPLSRFVPDVHDRRFCAQRSQEWRHATRRVFVHGHDWTRVHAGCPEEPVTILAWPGQCPFVCPNPVPERLEADPRKEATPHPDAIAAGPQEALLVDIHRRSRVLAEHSLAAPRRDETRGTSVPLVRVDVARVGVGKVQPHDVSGVSCEQALVLLGADDVVRRCDHPPQIDEVGGEAKRAERTDDGHLDLEIRPGAAGRGGDSADLFGPVGCRHAGSYDRGRRFAANATAEQRSNFSGGPGVDAATTDLVDQESACRSPATCRAPPSNRFMQARRCSWASRSCSDPWRRS